jgi:hypothetical protein
MTSRADGLYMGTFGRIDQLSVGIMGAFRSGETSLSLLGTGSNVDECRLAEYKLALLCMLQMPTWLQERGTPVHDMHM